MNLDELKDFQGKTTAGYRARYRKENNLVMDKTTDHLMSQLSGISRQLSDSYLHRRHRIFNAAELQMIHEETMTEFYKLARQHIKEAKEKVQQKMADHQAEMTKTLAPKGTDIEQLNYRATQELQHKAMSKAEITKAAQSFLENGKL